MQNIRNITNDLIYIGVSDRNIDLFENMLPTPNGMTYNSYLLADEKTVLLDAADAAVERQFFENLAGALNGRPLDYLVVHHAEPDHCALIAPLMLRYPDCQLVTNSKVQTFLTQFFGTAWQERTLLVKEGDTLCTGRHTLTWVMAPMVHWPEVMLTYDTTDHTLFSADAFGSFGALNGNIFNDEVNYERDWLVDARRYFLNIVGKYGVQVQNTLKKAATLQIDRICPLHGVIWRNHMDYIIDKYNTWSSYQPEEKGVLMLYASMYGHTENAVNCLATALAERGVHQIQIMNVSRKHFSDCLAAAYQWSHIVFASPTYNNGLYPMMELLLSDLSAHFWQNRTVALIENGTWAPCSGKLMAEQLSGMKNINLLEQRLSLKSALQPNQQETLQALADAIATSLQA